MSDIVEWLRGLEERRRNAFGPEGLEGCRYGEAAAEIARLRAELSASMTVRAELEHRIAGRPEDKLRASNLRLTEESDRLRAKFAVVKSLHDISLGRGGSGYPLIRSGEGEPVEMQACSRPDRRDSISWSDYDRLASDFAKLEDAARQDAETIARLCGLLERWMRHADSGAWRDFTDLSLTAAVAVADDTRAALACRPQEGTSR